MLDEDVIAVHEHPDAGRGEADAGFLGLDFLDGHDAQAHGERLADQPATSSSTWSRMMPVAGADLLGRSLVEATREDRQPRPQQLLLGRAQIEAPGDAASRA